MSSTLVSAAKIRLSASQEIREGEDCAGVGGDRFFLTCCHTLTLLPH
ncbi:MAG TPA: hypothetical protein V6D14_19970 [Coleofasciculaceae cyanobacterium]